VASIAMVAEVDVVHHAVEIMKKIAVAVIFVASFALNKY